MLFDTNKNKGRAGMAIAIAYFGANGYTVSIPLNDTQDYDLIVDKDGLLSRVTVKATGHKTGEDSYECSLKSCGGTNGGIYGNVLSSSADLLFALREDGLMYLIPIKEITTKSVIKLVSKKNETAPKNTFDTSKYLVHI